MRARRPRRRAVTTARAHAAAEQGEEDLPDCLRDLNPSDLQDRACTTVLHEEVVPAIGVETGLLAAAGLDTRTITRRRSRRCLSHLAAEEDLLQAAEGTPASGIIATELVVLLSLLGPHPWDLVAVAVRTAGMMTILRLIRAAAAAGVGATTEQESLPDRPGAAAERRPVPMDAMVLPEEEAATPPVVLAEPRTRREVPKVARKEEQVLPPLPEPQPVPRRRPPRRHLRSRVVRVEEA